MINTPPVLENDMIGGWATTRSNGDFASYDPLLGVMTLRDRVTKVSQIETPSAGDHVASDGALLPLTSDRTIGSLVANVGADALDLGGFGLLPKT